ncbi:MAG: diguanylate cyclase [Anaerolineae bacterium]|nr:diguanylate cyclase [Anaerolineae bacterium]
MDDQEKNQAQLIDELQALRKIITLQTNTALTQTLYSQLVATAMDAIVLIDNQQHILDFNAAAETMFGYKFAEVAGQPLTTLMPERFREKHPPHIQQFRETGVSSRTMQSLGAITGLRSNGQEFPLEISIAHIHFEQEDYYAAIIRDISERISLENLILRQYDSLNTLHLITLDLLNRRDIKDLLQFIVDQAVKLLEVNYCEILLPDGDELVAKAYTRNNPFLLGNRFGRDAGALSWQAFDSGRPAIVEDYSTWEHRNRIYDGEAFHAAAVIPILIAEKCIGVLGLTRNKPGYKFNEEQILTATRLAASIALAMENSRLYLEVNRLATIDELTGTHNRRSVLMIGEREYQRCLRFDRPFCVALLDVDHFKHVNDTWGHSTGDLVLRSISQEVIKQIRRTDTLGRYIEQDEGTENVMGRFGGEEFVILFPETPLEGAMIVANRINAAIQNMFLTAEDSTNFRVTASLGIALLNPKTDSLLDLINHADQALYQAKETGRNRVCVYTNVP